ncbi:MAG: hypothetical protein HY864_18925 [Chloroflexi bacterium]|nr:hypothetical protein [Chloroflexota bacterium]
MLNQPAISASIIISAIATAIVTWLGYHRTTQTFGNRKVSSSIWVGIFLAGWLATAMILGAQGFFLPNPEQQVPSIAYSAIPLVIGYLFLFASKSFQENVDSIPPHWIIGVQLYRILGIDFLILYFQHQIPGEFALPAGIGDMLIGITAPLVAYLYFRRHPSARTAAIIWNIAGIFDLTLAVTLGVLSSPGPLQLLAIQSPNELITAYPLVLVPVFAVPLSILLHLFSLRVLLGKKR